MGLGCLSIDKDFLKQVLALPDDCEIMQVLSDGSQLIELILVSPAIPDKIHANGHDYGVYELRAIVTQETPPDHVCPEGFQCKRLTTRFEVVGSDAQQENNRR